VSEAAIRKALNHPNVVELWGARSARDEPPWYFVIWCMVEEDEEGFEADLLRHL